MAAPIITPIPTPPIRSDAPADFSSKADAFVAALPGLVIETNASVAFTDQRAIDADGSAQAAADSAGAAAVSAAAAASVETDVSEQIARAEAAATNAENSATAAESAPGSIGNLALIHSLTIGMMRRF